MRFVYFAYGSNMLPERLSARCPSARVVGHAAAAGYVLEFSKISRDGSGKATLVVGEGKARGVLFEIANTDRADLDRAEGKGYARDDQFEVETATDGQRIRATTYVASAIDRQLKPYDWYLALVIAGAEYHSLGPEYLMGLRARAYRVDLHEDRESRLDALAALKAHGHLDYRLLVNPAA
jgi:cation transport regulator ChaC